MNTPNLDKLMEQAAQGPVVNHTFHQPYVRMVNLFAKHGPAMVAVLKKVNDEVECYCCDEGIALPQPCAACVVQDILTTLDQEAKG